MSEHVPLRFLADRYEQAQRVRIATGERIRALLQGRDPWGQDVETREEREDSEEIKLRLIAVRSGAASLPESPFLGQVYRRHWEEERQAFELMETSLESHPVWPRLKNVKGIGPTLACKLLARLDVRKAATPSSFWAYCGLTTVPGVIYRCDECGLSRTWPVGYKVSGRHVRLGSQAQCKGTLQKVAEGEEIRAAMPKSRRGERNAYDAYAKKVCYLIGCQFEKLGRRGPYGEFFRREKDKLSREKVGWTEGRIRFTAMRKTVKLFLSHLWEVWRAAEGLPTVPHYAESHLLHDTRITPEEMGW
jgi:hypothetical protein